MSAKRFLVLAAGALVFSTSLALAQTLQRDTTGDSDLRQKGRAVPAEDPGDNLKPTQRPKAAPKKDKFKRPEGPLSRAKGRSPELHGTAKADLAIVKPTWQKLENKGIGWFDPPFTIRNLSPQEFKWLQDAFIVRVSCAGNVACIYNEYDEATGLIDAPGKSDWQITIPEREIRGNASLTTPNFQKFYTNCETFNGGSCSVTVEVLLRGIEVFDVEIEAYDSYPSNNRVVLHY